MFLFPNRRIFSSNLKHLDVRCIRDIAGISNVAGYISYENYNEIEEIVLPDAKPFCNLPKIHFSQMESNENYDDFRSVDNFVPKIKWIKSNFTDETHKDAVKTILDYIKKGICYQVNLTRKFYGEFEEIPNAVNVFNKLYGVSPNPYAMLYTIDDERAVISSSPECFLRRNGNLIESVPIKGTISSLLPKENLYNIKDKSENLMITDLVRNDIGRVASKVWVEDFQNVYTFGQVHHMSSRVCGELTDGVSNADCVMATFPAGSMTGAPKIKAIEIANELEQIQRGVYSGCIGVIENDTNFDFAVTIRTIIIEGKKFEFQAGGAIVWDSIPAKEVEEFYLKIKGICAVLGIK
jgi:para-aminobenzoate synthetase component 1